MYINVNSTWKNQRVRSTPLCANFRCASLWPGAPLFEPFKDFSPCKGLALRGQDSSKVEMVFNSKELQQEMGTTSMYFIWFHHMLSYDMNTSCSMISTRTAWVLGVGLFHNDVWTWTIEVTPRCCTSWNRQVANEIAKQGRHNSASQFPASFDPQVLQDSDEMRLIGSLVSLGHPTFNLSTSIMLHQGDLQPVGRTKSFSCSTSYQEVRDGICIAESVALFFVSIWLKEMYCYSRDIEKTLTKL